jgi:hypothetical protein
MIKNKPAYAIVQISEMESSGKSDDFISLNKGVKGVFMKKSIMLSGVLAVLMMLFFGCFGTSVKKESAAAQPAAAASKPSVHNQYYDFPDVLIPGELKAKPNRSSIYRTPGYAAGLLVFEGRLDGSSLAAFFESNMTKDNWRSKAAIKFNPMILIFEKENRVCLIRIEEFTFLTRIEVWMAPASKETVSTIFN